MKVSAMLLSWMCLMWCDVMCLMSSLTLLSSAKLQMTLVVGDSFHIFSVSLYLNFAALIWQPLWTHFGILEDSAKWEKLYISILARVHRTEIMPKIRFIIILRFSSSIRHFFKHLNIFEKFTKVHKKYSYLRPTIIETHIIGHFLQKPFICKWIGRKKLLWSFGLVQQPRIPHPPQGAHKVGSVSSKIHNKPNTCGNLDENYGQI